MGKILGRKGRERFWGGNGEDLGGKGLRRKTSQQKKVAKDLREEKGEDLRGGKAIGGKGMIPTGKGGERSQKGTADDLWKKCLRGESGEIISTWKRS